jgi:Na+-transporting NADH:ubiquinone oxidoreductase subunit NqrD
MENQEVYSILITFFSIYVCKKIIDITIEAKYPTYKNLKKDPNIWKLLVQIRSMLCFVFLLFAFYILYSYKLNEYIYFLLGLVITNNLFYFMIEERYVYFFMDKKNIDEQFLDFLDSKVGMFSNVILGFLSLYIVINVFK